MWKEANVFLDTIDILYRNQSKSKENTLDEDTKYFLLSEEFYELGNGWKMNKVDEASKLLRRWGFFKRFSSIFLKAYLCHFEVKTFDKNKLIIIPKDTAVVLIGGFMRLIKFTSHTMQPLLAQLLIQGDFLFNSISFKSPTDCWLESITPVEVIFIK